MLRGVCVCGGENVSSLKFTLELGGRSLQASNHQEQHENQEGDQEPMAKIPRGEEEGEPIIEQHAPIDHDFGWGRQTTMTWGVLTRNAKRRKEEPYQQIQ